MLKNTARLNFVSCILGKQTREQFPKTRGTRAMELLEIVHSDVCGYMRVHL